MMKNLVRQQLENIYGPVWNQSDLFTTFAVLSPLTYDPVLVRRNTDSLLGVVSRTAGHFHSFDCAGADRQIPVTHAHED
jgi:hypothetical protein